MRMRKYWAGSLILCAALLFVSTAGFRAPLAAEPSNGYFDAIDFGAVADGETDCTEAIQKALDAAQSASGGVVTLPAGRFCLKGTLSIPRGVTLEGTYRGAVTIESKDQMPDGTILLAYAGRGTQDAEPFIRLAGNNATVKGLAVIYPEWNRADVPPIPYPPCVESHDTVNVAVLDCCLLNPYEGIKFVRAARHLVRNVTGYPVWRGLFVDECYDIGHIENIHYWPFGVTYDPKDPYCEWINLNGVAFELARTDWHYVANTFCFGYGVGYKFSDCGHDGTNGNFLGLGADSCRRAVLVEQAQKQGLLITNGEFVGRWRGEDSVCIEIGEKCAGKVSLVNCSFWGPIDTCIQMKSPRCPLTANACHFVHWDNMGLGKPAIDLLAGKANVSNCTFEQAGTCVRVSDDVQSAILTGNQGDGGFTVVGVTEKNRGRIQRFANETDPLLFEPEALLHYRFHIGDAEDGRFMKRWFGRETAKTPETTFPYRWSSASSEIALPVAADKPYTCHLRLNVPKEALAGDGEYGVYRGDALLTKLSAGENDLTFALSPTADDTVTLAIRVQAWETKGHDTRRLGVQGLSVEMKADGAPDKVYDAGQMEWAQ